MSQEVERAANLLEVLYGSGGLSEQSKDALVQAGAALEIGRGLGLESAADDLLLASILVDDSTSIGPLVVQIRQGHDLMLEALAAESASVGILVLTRALNRGLMSPFTDIAYAARLTPDNFTQSSQVSMTPLYLQSVLTLGTVMFKAQEVEAQGGKARTFTLIVTDGADNGSRGISAREVRAMVSDMLEFHTNHIVAGMGIGPDAAYFQRVFREMGIPSAWIFTPDSTVEELRAVFRKLAQSLRLAASSEAAFRQLAAGPPASDA